MDCGDCRIEPGYQVLGEGYVPSAIIFCPLHAAAAETAKQRDVLLEAAEKAIQIPTGNRLELEWARLELEWAVKQAKATEAKEVTP